MEQHIAEQEISLKELIQILLNNLVKVAVITLIVSLVTAGFTWYQLYNQQKAVILVDINHGNIAQGKNPDGSTFNPYDMVAPNILMAALESEGMSKRLSANDLRATIEIVPIVPESVVKKEEFLLEKEGETLTYHPTAFRIEMAANRSKGIDGAQAKTLLNAIVQAYIAEFSEEYIGTAPVTNKLLAFDPELYDYSDVAMVYTNQINTLKAYNQRLETVAPDFRSQSTGMSFTDILLNVQLLDDINLNRVNSLISSYKLTKDQQKLALAYEYKIEQLELQQAKLKKSKETTTALLQEVENSNDVVLSSVGQQAADHQSYFNSLVLQTSESGRSLSDIENEIAFYTAELRSLRSGTQTLYNQQEATQNLETQILKLQDDLLYWMDMTNKTSSEFYEKLMTNAIRPLAPAVATNTARPALNMAIGLVLGLMLATFAVFFEAYWKEA